MPIGRFKSIPWIEWSCYLVIIAMIYSPFLLSISMILLIVLSFIDFSHRGNSLRFNLEGWKNVFQFSEKSIYWMLTIFFWLILIRCWPIDDADYLLERLRIKLPFLLLPLIFAAFPVFREGFLKRIIWFMLIVFALTSIGILFNYWQNYEVLTEMIRKGHHIPTPRNHIRFSLLLAWAIIGGIYLLIFDFKRREKNSLLLLGIVFYLFLFIHVLSVKSGLLILYVGLFTLLVWYIWVEKRWLLGLVGVGSIILFPYLAYQFIPSFKNKIDYTRYDLMMFSKGEGGIYSDSGRLASLDVGWRIINEHWLWGVGTGNLRKSVNEQYEAVYPDYVEPFMIQNQFLYVWAGAGIIGLLLFLGTFSYPFFFQGNYRHPLFLSFYSMAFGAWMIEHAIENAVGVAHFLFFLLLLIKVLNSTKKET